MKVSCKYNAEFAEFLRSIGGKWNVDGRFWEVPEDRRAEVEAKAKELGVEGLKVEAEKPPEGAVRMRLSRDGRFVLISIDMLAFSEDVKALLEGKRKSVRFRLLPPRSAQRGAYRDGDGGLN
ncbi:MAG: hypothetical protein QW796_05905 [Thermoproteota archaeon]